MWCTYPSCPVNVKKSNARHWNEEQLCVIHAIMRNPDKYSYLLPKVQSIGIEILQFVTHK